MNYHDDFILFFLLTRSAKSIKYIDRVFYIIYPGWKKDNKVFETFFSYKITSGARVKNKIHGGKNQTSILMLNDSF